MRNLMKTNLSDEGSIGIEIKKKKVIIRWIWMQKSNLQKTKNWMDSKGKMILQADYLVDLERCCAWRRKANAPPPGGFGLGADGRAAAAFGVGDDVP